MYPVTDVESIHRRGPPTVARALQFFQFTLYREGRNAQNLSTATLLLVCRELQPPSDGRLTFRILDAEATRDGMRKAVRSRFAHRANHAGCQDPELFALVAAIPQRTQVQLIPKLHDAVVARRVFSILSPESAHPNRVRVRVWERHGGQPNSEREIHHGP